MDLSILKKQLLKPQTMTIVWFGVALICAILKTSLEPDQYNNFLIFRGVADHLFAGDPLYTTYPDQYNDINHYGPFFGFIIAPFAWLPTWLAVPLWVVTLSMLLCWAIRSLPIKERWKSVILLIAVNDMFGAAAMQQFNLAIAAILVGSFVLIQKRKEGWAAAFLVIGVWTKIYGIVGLAMFFFVKRKIRFIFYFVFWSAVAILLPLLFVNPQYLWQQYGTWIFDLLAKNNDNQFAFLQNISMLGFFRKTTGCETYSDLWILIPAVILFLSTYLRYKQFKQTTFRLLMLASSMIFLVIFSSGSENSGYIVATVGVGIWWVTLKKRGWLEWTILVAVMFASFARNIIPEPYYTTFVRYSLRALPFFAVWIHLLFRMWREDFGHDNQTLHDSKPTTSDIDLILPCYNPDEKWVERVDESFKLLQHSCPSHHFRLIVSNDGSKRNFTPQFTDRLIELVPETIIVDNQENRGKGAAVRAAVTISTAPLVLYTDYDFPYLNECMCKVVVKLEEGCDIVIAARNQSYHRELTTFRKLLSWTSRNMNWLILGMKYPDAQGGLKGFNERGKKIFLDTKVERFLFDTEFIYKASKNPDIKIGQIKAFLREGVHLPSMGSKTMRREALNFFKIVFSIK